MDQQQRVETQRAGPEGVLAGSDWVEMKEAGGEDLLKLLKNDVRDKPLLRAKTGKKGKVVKLY